MRSEVIKRIIEDYPVLKNKELKIIRQFKASYGRDYDVYLVEIKEAGQWIAKGTSISDNSLQKEKKAIEILLKGGINIPKLFDPNISPNNYLLIEYIEGKRLDEIIGKNDIKLFTKVGVLVGKLHNTHTPNYGDLLGNERISWFDLIDKKYKERFTASKKKLDSNTNRYIEEVWQRTEASIKEDGRNEPVAVHRDLYLDNFIINSKGEMFIIDFGLTLGGRPLFDLGKFYILVLKNYSDLLNVFLDVYRKYVEVDK